MRTVIRHLAAGVLALIVFPAVCLAQFGAIAGVVKDSTGAVLPGVTVEAASPALIEKTRSAVSDSAGQFSVQQLRPGVYTVTFTLMGFSTVRREGIEISAGFTAPVNASLKVGAVAETITVTGEAPVVDVQSSSERKQLPKEALDALPTARGFAVLGTTLPGVTANQRDVGGTQGERGNVLSAHGGNVFDMTVHIDGVPIANLNTGVNSGAAWSNFSLNDAAAQEMVFETGAISTETSSGGVRVNVVPREGGNRFSGSAFGNFSKRSMEMNNLTADLQARNPLLRTPGFDSLVDESGAFGGPIRHDRLWFFVAHRYRSNDLTGSNQFYSINPLAYTYNPDFTRPLNAGGFDMDNQVRVTAQVSPRNKLSGFYDQINKCNCPTIADSALQTGESGTRLTYPYSYLTSLTWQSTISPKLLFDGAISYNTQPTDNSPQPSATTVTLATASALELSTGRRLRAPFGVGGGDQAQRQGRAALSYVTGSHAAKVGMTWHDGWATGYTYPYSSDMGLQLLNGNPVSVVLRTDPYTTVTNLNADMGIYAQDRWTMRRLTLSGGVRFDYFNMSIPAQSAAASRWVGARSYAEIDNVPNWKDIDPRVGVSYDLFGNGKTAIKASVSRYVSGSTYTFTAPINPLGQSVNSVTRGWTDTNHDFIPQGDPLNPLPNGEFTGTINPLFGSPVVTTHYDPAVSQGWGKRPYNWEYSVSVQHELIPRVSVDGGYYRRVFGNFTVTDNQNITPADYTPFCIMAPTDTRLGSVSGSQVCGLADISAAKAGVAALPSNQIITFASNYAGETSQTYNGVDFNVNARPTGRLFLQAGVSTGRTVTKNCALVDNPQTLRFCAVTPPFLPNYRVSGGYTFPWQLQVSGVFQSIATTPVTSIASLPVTNATAGLTLGRPIATSGGVINAPLIDPSTYTAFADRVNQVDLRLTKGFRLGRYRLDALVDFYNAFNLSPVLTYTTTYSAASWLAPTSILQSGYVKLGGRLTF
jgi:hypothetical protein